MLDEKLAKKIANLEDRTNDAKAKFDKKMADKLAKFNAKVKLKSKTMPPAPSAPSDESSTQPSTAEPSDENTGSGTNATSSS
jgi:hypothetical protein